MTTLDAPMSLDDALRIIHNVAEHNTREIPSPQEVAEAMSMSLMGAHAVTQEYLGALSWQIKTAIAEICKVLQLEDTMMRQSRDHLGEALRALRKARDILIVRVPGPGSAE